MPSLLAPIKARLRLLVKHRSTLLHPGEHMSVHRHRSMEFEDLREYSLGDDVADIDWKATARSAAPLLRRYTAMRAHEIVFAVDAGLDMTGTAAGGEPTRAVVVELVGALGLAAVDNGDRVGVVLGDASGSSQVRGAGTQRHLEQVLGVIDAAARDASAGSSVVALLRDVTRRVRRRSLIVVITGDVGESIELDRALGAVRARHDVIWLTVGDLDPTDARVAAQRVDIGASGIEVPAFLRRPGRRSGSPVTRDLQQRQLELRALLGRRRVPTRRVRDVAAVVPALIEIADEMRGLRGRHRT